MAGIGFELRKVFQKRSLISVIKGFSTSAFVAIGPMIISIVLMIFIDKILEVASISLIQRETIKATIMYGYVFSMINTSGFIMIISRYLADKLYIKDTSDILSSLAGAMATTLLIGGLAAAIFFFKSSIPVLQKFLSYMIFIELSIIYILMVYISAVKDYKKVALSFISGSGISLVLSLFVLLVDINIVPGILFSLTIGYFVNIIILLFSVKQYFGVISKNVFSFFLYFKEHYKLFLINLFFTVGMFIHNMIFWRLSAISQNIMETYYYAPPYDTAFFFAVLTIIPSAIIFVVKFETTFYERYKYFRDAIVKGGSLKDLVTTKDRMIDTLKRELTFIMEIQLISTIVLIILGVYIILPAFANDSLAIELFVFLSIGYFMSFMSFIIIIILLYFDLQKRR